MTIAWKRKCKRCGTSFYTLDRAKKLCRSCREEIRMEHLEHRIVMEDEIKSEVFRE